MSFPGSTLALLTWQDVTKPEDEKLLTAHSSKFKPGQANPAAAAQMWSQPMNPWIPSLLQHPQGFAKENSPWAAGNRNWRAQFGTSGESWWNLITASLNMFQEWSCHLGALPWSLQQLLLSVWEIISSKPPEHLSIAQFCDEPKGCAEFSPSCFTQLSRRSFHIYFCSTPPSCTAAAWGQNSSCAGSFPCTLHLHPAAAPRDGIFPVHSPTNTSMLKFAVNTCKSQYLSNKSAETNIFVCIKELEFPLQLPEPLAIVTLVPSCIVFASARY